MSTTLPPAFHESLPYIDAEPDEASLAAARSLIDAELATSSTTAQQLPPLRSPSFTRTLQTELDRIASSAEADPSSQQQIRKNAPLDLSRYEAQEQPLPGLPPAELQSVLAKSYTSATYLSLRTQNLELLDAYGKNAWLVGNHELEGELRRLEAELARTNKEIDVVNIERRKRQEQVRGEMQGLEEGWRRGVGRVLETEVGVEELKREVREELRRQAQAL